MKVSSHEKYDDGVTVIDIDQFSITKFTFSLKATLFVV